jgi:hypothetical protein
MRWLKLPNRYPIYWDDARNNSRYGSYGYGEDAVSRGYATTLEELEG